MTVLDELLDRIRLFTRQFAEHDTWGSDCETDEDCVKRGRVMGYIECRDDIVKLINDLKEESGQTATIE